MKTLYPASLFVLLLALTACEKLKTDNCPTPEKIILSSNSPVIAGWPLYLSTSGMMNYLYHWKGPNGFSVKYSYYSSSANTEMRQNITAADAGEYIVELLDENGCVVYFGSIMVEVTTAPTAPCSIKANSGVSSGVGVGDGDNYSLSVYNNRLEAYAPGHTIKLNFPGNSRPKTGIYKTSGYFAINDDNVGLYISLFTKDFTSISNQLVYANNVAGKLDISFCDHQFSNPYGGSPIKCSVHLLEK